MFEVIIYITNFNTCLRLLQELWVILIFFSKNEKTFNKMQHELIKKLFLEGRNCMEIQKELDKKFGEQAYKQRAIYKHLENSGLAFHRENNFPHLKIILMNNH